MSVFERQVHCCSQISHLAMQTINIPKQEKPLSKHWWHSLYYNMLYSVPHVPCTSPNGFSRFLCMARSCMSPLLVQPVTEQNSYYRHEKAAVLLWGGIYIANGRVSFGFVLERSLTFVGFYIDSSSSFFSVFSIVQPSFEPCTTSLHIINLFGSTSHLSPQR